MSPRNPLLSILGSLMDLGTATIIAITGPAFTESRGLTVPAVKAMRSPFHVSRRAFHPTSTSSGCRP